MASPGEVVAELLGLAAVPAALRPRFNIAPTQEVGVVRAVAQGRRLDLLRWGLVPSWARDESVGSRLINARLETLAEKPAFRAAYRARRCLVVADGFYEWAPGAGRKQPWLFRRGDASPFAFAGLWERWLSAEGRALETCTIVTTAANELVATVHGRMPLILPRAAYEAWLDPDLRPGPVLDRALEPLPAAEMTAYPVGLAVNSPANDSPSCLTPLAGRRAEPARGR